jgi:diphthamide biosynthesis protein 7
MENIKKLESWDTQLYADCVEFCPFEPYLSIAICGTYQLCESEAARVGRLSLHSVDPENIDLTPIQLVDTPGILDVKWCRKKSYQQISLAVANSIGQIVLYSFDSDISIKQQHVQNIGDDGTARLALSCDWYEGYKIAVSDSKGEVSCLNVSVEGSEPISNWKAHDYEAWVASFDRYSDQLIYSGGDDSCFRLWDLRDTARPVLANKKAHQMGVTSIETSPVDCNIVATGRYTSENFL